MASSSTHSWPTPPPRHARRRQGPLAEHQDEHEMMMMALEEGEEVEHQPRGQRTTDDDGAVVDGDDRATKRPSNATSTTFTEDIIQQSSSSSSSSAGSRVAEEIRSRMRQLEQKYAQVFTTGGATADSSAEDEIDNGNVQFNPEVGNNLVDDDSCHDPEVMSDISHNQNMQDMSHTSYDSGTVRTADMYHDQSLNKSLNTTISGTAEDLTYLHKNNMSRILSSSDNSTMHSQDDEDIQSLDDLVASPPQSSLFFSGNPLEMSSSSGSPSKSTKKTPSHGQLMSSSQEQPKGSHDEEEDRQDHSDDIDSNMDDTGSFVFQTAILPGGGDRSKGVLATGTGPGGNVELMIGNDLNSAGVPMGIDVPGENEIPKSFLNRQRVHNMARFKSKGLKTVGGSNSFPVILRMPNTAFGVAIGLAGNAMIWHAARDAPFLDDRIDTNLANNIFWFLSFVSTIMIGLLYIYKMAFHRPWVVQEFRHIARTHFFNAPHIVLILLVLAVPKEVGMSPTTKEVIFIVGLVAQFGVTLLTHVRDRNPSRSRPQYLLGVIGWFLLAILGISLDVEQRWGIAIPSFCLGIGAILYISTGAAIWNGPGYGSPSMSLILAPPSLAAITIDGLVESNDGTFPILAECILGWALLLLLLLIRFAPRLSSTPPSFGAYWTYAFPLTTVTTACIRYSVVTDSVASRVLALVSICVSIFATCTVFIWMVIHMFRCVWYDGQWGDVLLGIPSKQGRSVFRQQDDKRNGWYPEMDDMEEEESADRGILMLNNSHVVPFEDGDDDDDDDGYV